MKVKIHSKQLPNGKQENHFYENVKDFFPGNQLKNIRSAKIELDDNTTTNIELRIDLMEMEVEGEARTYITNKEGILGQVHSIKFIDGTEDVYV